jgi:hypothetical protein
MYSKVEKQMRQVVKANGFTLGSHAAGALRDENFTAKDVMHCFLYGTIVSDQYDPDVDDVKYEWHGPSLDGREMAMIAKFTYSGNVFIITVFWLTWIEYE